jgi:thiol-disulfide isomerase/thioredoxin
MIAMVNKFIGALFLTIILCGTLQAGTIRGQITLISGAAPAILLLRTYVNPTKTDTIYVGTYGDFKVDVPSNFPVSCGLNVGRSFFSFIYVPSEKDTRISITTENGVLTKGTIENSPENQAYNELESLMKEFDRGLFQNVKADSPELMNYIEEYNSALNAFQYKFKGTYVADVIAQMRKMKTDKKLGAVPSLRLYFFDNVKFADSSMVANPMLANLVSFYTRAVIDTGAKAKQQFVTGIMNKAAVNTYVYKSLALSMFNDIMDDKDELMMQAYLAWFKASADTAVLPVLKVKTRALAKVMPGQPAIDIKIVEDGKTLASLKQTAAENKLTLLMIWESHCSHCREAIPKVKELHDMYKTKGFEVFGVSFDNNQNDWESFIIEKDLKWKNVLAMQTTGGVEEYFVQSTPTFVLINTKGEITHRLMDVKGVARYVRTELK